MVTRVVRLWMTDRRRRASEGSGSGTDSDTDSDSGGVLAGVWDGQSESSEGGASRDGKLATELKLIRLAKRSLAH